MTNLAVIAGRYVVRVLASRDRAVVAAHTIRRDETMIKGRTLPTPSAMTSSALVRALDMVDWPVRSHPTHVTRLAVLADGGMIHPCRFPEACRMTVVAIRLDRNMARRGARFGSRAATSVAGLATHGRTEELTADMATLTVHTLMPAGEREASDVMVKARARLRESHSRQGENEKTGE